MFGGFRFLYYLSKEHLVWSSHLFNNNKNILTQLTASQIIQT